MLIVLKFCGIVHLLQHIFEYCACCKSISVSLYKILKYQSLVQLWERPYMLYGLNTLYSSSFDCHILFNVPLQKAVPQQIYWRKCESTPTPIPPNKSPNQTQEENMKSPPPPLKKSLDSQAPLKQTNKQKIKKQTNKLRLGVSYEPSDSQIMWSFFSEN